MLFTVFECYDFSVHLKGEYLQTRYRALTNIIQCPPVFTEVTKDFVKIDIICKKKSLKQWRLFVRQTFCSFYTNNIIMINKMFITSNSAEIWMKSCLLFFSLYCHGNVHAVTTRWRIAQIKLRYHSAIQVTVWRQWYESAFQNFGTHCGNNHEHTTPIYLSNPYVCLFILEMASWGRY